MSSIWVFYDEKSLFQVVTKCENNYRFLKNICPLYRPLLIKHPLVKKSP